MESARRDISTEKRFAEVTLAYTTLSDESSRLAYDLSSVDSLLRKAGYNYNDVQK